MSTDNDGIVLEDSRRMSLSRLWIPSFNNMSLMGNFVVDVLADGVCNRFLDNFSDFGVESG